MKAARNDNLAIISAPVVLFQIVLFQIPSTYSEVG
jgi:hypothetical protein